MALRTAVIGMGKMGHTRKRFLDAHPAFDVTTLCDVNEEVRDEFPEQTYYKEWQDALKEPLDVVIVCTFNKITPDVVCAALEKGCHVFSEKPPGCCVGDVEKIIEAEKKATGKVVKFGFNHRFHYSVMEAKAIIDSGRYGRLLWARGVYGKAGGLLYDQSWRAQRDISGGGILLDQGIHMLDLIRYFMGEFVEIKSFVENSYWRESDLEDNAFALLRTADGQVAMLHSSATHWKHKFLLDMFFEDGYISLDGILSSTRSYGEERITFARKQFEDEAYATGKPREESIYFDTDDSWRLEIEEFYDCISGTKDRPMGDTAEALEVMQLIEKIYAAGESGKK